MRESSPLTPFPLTQFKTRSGKLEKALKAGELCASAWLVCVRSSRWSQGSQGAVIPDFPATSAKPGVVVKINEEKPRKVMPDSTRPTFPRFHPPHIEF